MDIENVMENMVEANLDECIEHAGACKCQRCRHDIKALALNMLPSYYSTDEKSIAMVHYMLANKQGKIDIHATIMAAIKKVEANPRH